MKEGAQGDEDHDQAGEHHHRLIDQGVARQAEQLAEDERHPEAQHQADDQEQHGNAEQVANERDRAKGQGGDRPYRIAARQAGDVAERAAELAEPFD